jgi:hypothetical protein
MNVLILEHPRKRSQAHFNDIANTPLWSCLLSGYAAAAVAKTGAEVSYVDAASLGLDFGQCRAHILAANPDLVAINTVYFWEHTDLFFSMLTALRQDGYKGHISLFGFFPTLHFQTILRESTALDSIVVGECEETLAELSLCLAQGQAWHTIAGLATGHLTPSLRRRPVIADLDGLLRPWRPAPSPSTPAILASRGCYNHCSFCPIPSFYNQGPLWRGRNPAHVVAEIQELQGQGHQDFYFVDPNFVGPGSAGRNRTRELMKLLKPLQITFGMETRPNDLDAELVAEMGEAGLTSLLLGIESGSGQGLANLDKHCSVRSGEEALRLCRAQGIEPEVGFLMFTPESRLTDLAGNMAFLERNSLLDRLERTANLLGHCQIIMAGTKGYQRYKHQGRLSPTGVLAFEGEVAFQEPVVAWLAQVVIPLCHHILRLTGDQNSPLYHERAGNYCRFQKVNDHLVQAVKKSLALAARPEPPAPEQLVAATCHELDTLIRTTPLIS